MKERWCAITWLLGYINLYAVSNFGNVRSEFRPVFSSSGKFINWREGRQLIPFHSRKYLTVKFTNAGIERSFLIHRLVAKAFIPIPEKYLQQGYTWNTLEVNHIDGNTENNFVNNLEWCTKRENMDHAVRTGLIPPGKKGGSSPRARKVAMYDLEGNLVHIFDSVTDAGLFFGINRISHITAVCRGTRFTSCCHIFRYVDDIEAVETKISVPELPHTSLDQINRKKYDTFRSAGQLLKNS